MKLSQAIELFMIEQSFRGNSKYTIEYYKIALEMFEKWLKSDEVESLDIITYKKYVMYLQSQNIKSTSVNSYTRAVKAFYNYLIDEDIIPDISNKLMLSKAIRQVIEPLTDEEIQILISSLRGDFMLLDCEVKNEKTCSK